MVVLRTLNILKFEHSLSMNRDKTRADQTYAHLEIKMSYEKAYLF